MLINWDNFRNLNLFYGIYASIPKASIFQGEILQAGFPCPDCGKLFRYMSKLNTHLITHSNLKPFKCLYCDLRYTQQGSMRRHMAREHAHTDDVVTTSLIM